MNKELKKALHAAFEVPVPQKKQAFMKRIRNSEISNFKFLLIQAAYIRKWVWGISFVIVMFSLYCGYFMDKYVLWGLSAIMPLLAVSALAENIRSGEYGMAELEMATRFSLRSVVMARMSILGMVHFGVLCLAALLGHPGGDTTLFQTGVYLLVPYLLTDVSGLWMFRKLGKKESLYGAMGLSFVIAAIPSINRELVQVLYGTEYFGLWLVILLVLCAITISETKKNLERTEELTWNLL